MPRMSSKITIKLDPELLSRLQDIAEIEGVSVSNYVRRSVLKNLREKDAAKCPHVLNLDLSMLETATVTQLVRIGVIRDPQELFHKAFDSYMSNDLRRTLAFARDLESMKAFPPTVPLTARRRELDPFEDIDEGGPQGDEEKGEG